MQPHVGEAGPAAAFHHFGNGDVAFEDAEVPHRGHRFGHLRVRHARLAEDDAAVRREHAANLCERRVAIRQVMKTR
jgi:hypothetical protein